MEKFTKIADDAQRQFDNTNPSNIDSIGMLDLSINSAELSLNIARDAEHNAPHYDLLDSLIERVSILRGKLELMKSKL